MDKHRPWIPLNTELDILSLMKQVRSFHDSCIKELRYISGAYVDHDLSMFPLNNLRQISLIIQRQDEHYSAIELQFGEVYSLSLCPQDGSYTTEILEATFMIFDNRIIWSDHFIEPLKMSESIGEECGIIICAKTARWRDVSEYLGEDIIYVGNLD